MIHAKSHLQDLSHFYDERVSPIIYTRIEIICSFEYILYWIGILCELNDKIAIFD